MSAIKAELEKHNFRHPSFGKTEVYIIIMYTLYNTCIIILLLYL